MRFFRIPPPFRTTQGRRKAPRDEWTVFSETLVRWVMCLGAAFALLTLLYGWVRSWF
jgi:hypothetical protein